MRGLILPLLLLLSACKGGGEDNQTAERDAGSSSVRPTVQTAELTGLYVDKTSGEQRARMCMTPDASGSTAFGIVTEKPEGGSCGGAGQAERERDILRLTMTGDEACVIEARISGTGVAFPSALPQGCAYYCAPGASLAGEQFEKTEGTAEAAGRPLDLAGDPLCG